jgi:ubiquinone/menaquinone biosynthesis C-methylase UbiE
MDFPDSSMDIVLLMGPLYHTQKSDDRLSILHEAIRVLKPGGYLFCTIISRFASFLDGLVSGFIRDPEFRQIVKGDLHDSCHNNHTDRMEYFTTAYFQHPDELKKELHETGLKNLRLLGIEGVLWASNNWLALRKDRDAWEATLEFMRSIESERSVIGASPHIMGIGKKPSE